MILWYGSHMAPLSTAHPIGPEALSELRCSLIAADRMVGGSISCAPAVQPGDWEESATRVGANLNLLGSGEIRAKKSTMALFTGPRQIEFREISRPVPKPNQVLVKIKACAICTVERRAWSGTKVSGLGEVFVGGHEASGEVVEVGEAVIQGFKPGDKVVMGLGSDCGACYYCRRGENQRCEHFYEI